MAMFGQRGQIFFLGVVSGSLMAYLAFHGVDRRKKKGQGSGCLCQNCYYNDCKFVNVSMFNDNTVVTEVRGEWLDDFDICDEEEEVDVLAKNNKIGSQSSSDYDYSDGEMSDATEDDEDPEIPDGGNLPYYT